MRELDAAHVQALARSIALQGLLVPLVVRPAGERFELVAGFHRAAAARSLGMTDVPIVVREAESDDADRAVENITSCRHRHDVINADVGITPRSALIARKQLNPLEEARAVRAMLQRGLSEDGAAQALGWAKARVTARVKILELPEAAQHLVGDNVIALGAIDNLLAVGRVSPELLDALVAYINENRWAADRLSREPGWVLGQAMREGQVKTFGGRRPAARIASGVAMTCSTDTARPRRARPRTRVPRAPRPPRRPSRRHPRRSTPPCRLEATGHLALSDQRSESITSSHNAAEARGRDGQADGEAREL